MFSISYLHCKYITSRDHHLILSTHKQNRRGVLDFKKTKENQKNFQFNFKRSKHKNGSTTSTGKAY
jgi:hypothetical protein